VSAAKQATANLLEQCASDGAFPAATARASDGGIDLFQAEDGSAAGDVSVGRLISEWLTRGQEGGYVAVLGYFAPSPEREAAVDRLLERLRTRTGLATTFGYGPRYLHSTGQLHKGGPEGGVFLVITADPVEDLDLPDSDFSLGTLLRAQALGDVRTLRERGREALHANVGWDVESGLETLAQAVEAEP
jgi:hypothetical protein